MSYLSVCVSAYEIEFVTDSDSCRPYCPGMSTRCQYKLNNIAKIENEVGATMAGCALVVVSGYD